MFLSAEDQILKFMQSVVHTSRGSIFLATNHEDTDIQIGLFKATGSMVACYFVSILITWKEYQASALTMQTIHKKVQSLSTDNAFISSLKPPTLASFSGRISLVRSICNSDHPHADLFCLLATNLKREILVRRESSLVCLHVIIVSITSWKREILVRREQYPAPRGGSVLKTLRSTANFRRSTAKFRLISPFQWNQPFEYGENSGAI